MSEALARFTPNRVMMAGLAAGLMLFVAGAAGALLTAQPGDFGEGLSVPRVALWLVIVVSPVYAADIVVRLIRGTPTLVATGEGIRMRSILGFTEPIPWREIDRFAPEVISKKLWLGIYLKDPRRTLAGYSMPMRLMHVRSHDAGTPNITYRHIHLGRSPAEAAEILQEILEQRKVDPKNTSE